MIMMFEKESTKYRVISWNDVLCIHYYLLPGRWACLLGAAGVAVIARPLHKLQATGYRASTHITHPPKERC